MTTYENKDLYIEVLEKEKKELNAIIDKLRYALDIYWKHTRDLENTIKQLNEQKREIRVIR